jgi:hypothetical protein
MWQCLNCKTEIADTYAHCWHCGAKHVTPPVVPREPTRQSVTPKFESYEDLSEAPSGVRWMWRRNPLTRLFWFLIVLGFVKGFDSPFLRTYGNYILGVSGVLVLAAILWRFFRHDPNEGVGIKLD